MALRRARSSCTVFALAVALLQLQHMAFSKGRVPRSNGNEMSAEEFQRAKIAHRKDPTRNPDPREDLGPRNMGYDVKNGQGQALRAVSLKVIAGSQILTVHYNILQALQ
eukprot:5193657-Amphidinium_carterae.1